MRWERELLYYDLTFFAEFKENGFSSKHTQTLPFLEAIPKRKSIGAKLFVLGTALCMCL